MDLAIGGNPNRGRLTFIFAGAAVSTVALAALLSPHTAPAYVAAGAGAGAVALVLTGAFAARHKQWLGCFLVLEELLPYANILPFDPQSRWFLRYPLLLALALPAAPDAVRSGALWQGGFKAMSLYYMWAGLSVLCSIAPATSLGRLFPTVLLYVALTSLAMEVNDREDIERVMGYFVFGCGIMVAIDLVALVALPHDFSWINEEGLERFSGLFGSPNVLGDIFQACLGATYLCWRRAAGWKRIGLVLAVAGATFLAVLADSRTPFLTVLIGIAAYTVWRHRARGVLICAAVLATAVVAWSFAGPRTRAYFNRDVTTLTGRTEAWEFEWREIKEHPFRGYGFEVEGEIFQNPYFPSWEEFWNRGVNTSLHNSLFAIAVELGIPALLFWMFVSLRPFVDAFRRDADPWELKPLVLLTVLPILLNGLTESMAAEPRYPRGLLFVLCWAITERRRMLAVAEDELARNRARVAARGVFAAIVGDA